ncbi:MAG: Fe-S cluster assembly protein SufD [Hyphomicrobiaceae bacterium]|nr:Fe-S cluster assembly protein SufD [Hyphomicrobiaceae bacterium]
MTIAMPIRLGPAEEVLIAQLESTGAKEAADALRAKGLPNRKVEAYHYTDLKTMLRDVPGTTASADAVSAPKFQIAGAYRVLIANGVASHDGTPPNGIIVSEEEGNALNPRDDVIVGMNRGLTSSHLKVRFEGSVDPVVHLDYRLAGEAHHVATSVLIEVADGATATVVQSFSGSDAAHLGNHGTRIVLGKDAHLLHVIIDQSGMATRHFHTMEYAIDEKVQLKTLGINLGAGLSRTSIFGSFNGGGAHADFSGMNLIDARMHCDVKLDLTHAVPDTTSTELYKAVVRGDGTSAFQGRIVVAQDAQKTDAKMMSQGLMLSDEAQIFTKPELEIYADDVQCGHGATTGDLDENSLFYLMSRGIPKDEAAGILTCAFVQELLDRVEDAELNEALTGLVDEWLTSEGRA